MKFGYQRAEDGEFLGKGLRSFFEYRDLGIGVATDGKFHAQVIRATDICRDGTGRHTHTLDFQMVYVLKGTVTFWYEGEGEITMGPGDCVHQPPGIQHELMSCSAECELLEITSPEAFETHDV